MIYLETNKLHINLYFITDAVINWLNKELNEHRLHQPSQSLTSNNALHLTSQPIVTSTNTYKVNE